jgi:ADP-ribose pyrophosphatase YjhB (NUDIX family)
MKRVSARGLVITDKGLAVIFRRKINEFGTKEYYVIPGGGIEENEDIIGCLKRELKEELDIEVNVKDLAFTKETEDRIEYFYNCEFISGNFKLNGEEIERMSESNYYEPTFIPLNKINDYDLLDEVKDYFNK